jgi:hypothetical protein
MALDQSAAAVGLGQLQSLPFKNIIGGPLTAAIDAQALAAETTVRFIERIGFDIVNGQHHAVNLEFTYEDATGYFRRVTVPLLSVVPIPFIVIETVDIQFKARISASAEQSSSSSSESALALNGSASYGSRRFGASVNISGSYSAKKDSKASQESKYSVEYTLDVQVHATQAGIPQGMAQILNILQDGISNRPHSNQITMFSLNPVLIGPSGTSGAFDDTSFKLLVLDANGEPVAANVNVVLTSASGLVKQDTIDNANASSGLYAVTFSPGTKYAALTPGDATDTLQIEVTVGVAPNTEVTTLSRAVTVRKPS